MSQRILQLISVALFVALVVLVSATWYYAFANDFLPADDFDYAMGGPWNHNAEMTQFVDFVCGVGSLAAFASFACLVTARSVRDRWIAGGAIFACAIAVGYHIQLID